MDRMEREIAMQQTLSAIKARIEGNYDNPNLIAQGPLFESKSVDCLNFIYKLEKELKEIF